MMTIKDRNDGDCEDVDVDEDAAHGDDNDEDGRGRTVGGATGAPRRKRRALLLLLLAVINNSAISGPIVALGAGVPAVAPPGGSIYAPPWRRQNRRRCLHLCQA